MEEYILSVFSQYTYEPTIVIAVIFGFMFICSLGVPIPEEVIIISAGLVGHMALHPEEYPPPYPGAHAAHPYLLAFMTFIAVMLTDYFIFSMGKFFGRPILNSEKFKKYFPEEKMLKVRAWTSKYGKLAPAVFRFIPGVRFPGHLMCGALGVPGWAFLLADGTAALFSVPTQVLLVSFYGRDILLKMKEFKLYVLILIVALVCAYLVRRFLLGKSSSLVS